MLDLYVVYFYPYNVYLGQSEGDLLGYIIYSIWLPLGATQIIEQMPSECYDELHTDFTKYN